MWVVRHCGVAANAVEVLDTPLSRQAVIVPADGIEDVLASHSLEARDQIGMGIGEDVADMQRARHRRWGSVDAVHIGAALGSHERVGVVGLPARDPLVLKTLQRRFLGTAAPMAVGASVRGPAEMVAIEILENECAT